MFPMMLRLSYRNGPTAAASLPAWSNWPGIRAGDVVAHGARGVVDDGEAGGAEVLAQERPRVGGLVGQRDPLAEGALDEAVLRDDGGRGRATTGRGAGDGRPHLGGDGLGGDGVARRVHGGVDAADRRLLAGDRGVLLRRLVVLVAQADEVAELVRGEARVRVARVPVRGVRATGRRARRRDDDVHRGVGRGARARDELEVERVARIIGVREPERVPHAGDVGAPLRHPGMVRRAGEPDVDGDLEPIGQQPPGERGGSAGDRRLPRAAPSRTAPGPTSTGPDTASRAVQVSGPTTPSSPSGGVLERWNSLTAWRVRPPNLPSTSSRVATWSGGTVLSFCCSSSTAGPVELRRIVGWIVPPSGAPRGSPSAGPSTTLRPWRETRGASSSILAHVSRPQTPSATSGGLEAWNEITAAAVMRSNTAVIRSGGVAAPSASSACWSWPTSTLGPSPCRSAVCVGAAGAAGAAPPGAAGAAPGASSRWSSTGGRLPNSDPTAALPALRWSAMTTIDDAACIGRRTRTGADHGQLGRLPGAAARSVAATGPSGPPLPARSLLCCVCRPRHAIRSPGLPLPLRRGLALDGGHRRCLDLLAAGPPRRRPMPTAVPPRRRTSPARWSASSGALESVGRVADPDAAGRVRSRPPARGTCWTTWLSSCAMASLTGHDAGSGTGRTNTTSEPTCTRRPTDGLGRLRRPVVGVDADALERLPERPTPSTLRVPSSRGDPRPRPDRRAPATPVPPRRPAQHHAGVTRGALEVHEAVARRVPANGRATWSLLPAAGAEPSAIGDRSAAWDVSN